MEESVRLTLVLSVPIWAAMSIFVIVAAIFAGLSGIGVAFAAVFFATIFWFVAVTKILSPSEDSQRYRSMSIENRLSSIEETLRQIAKEKKE